MIGEIVLGAILLLVAGVGLFYLWAILYPIWFHVNDGNLAYAGITALVIILMFGLRGIIAALFRAILR